MSDYEFRQLIEDHAPSAEEWSIERADKQAFVDHRDCLEARLGNFLRICATVWHPAHLHKTSFGNPQLDGFEQVFSQTSQFGEDMTVKIRELLEELGVCV